MAAALRSLQKLGSIGVAAAAATTLSYNKPSACDQRRRFEGKTIVITGRDGFGAKAGAVSTSPSKARRSCWSTSIRPP